MGPTPLVAATTSTGHMDLITTPQNKIAQLVYDNLSGDQCNTGHQTPCVFKMEAKKKKLAALKETLRALDDDDLEVLYTLWSRFNSKNEVLRASSTDAERKKNNDFPTISFEKFVLRAVYEKERDTLYETPPITLSD